MAKNKKKPVAKKTTTTRQEDATVPSMESAVIASDERKRLSEDKPAPAKTKTSKKVNMSLIESDLTGAVKNLEAELAIVKDTVVITAASKALAKNASAAVWRKIGELRKDGIIDSLPKVETKIS